MLNIPFIYDQVYPCTFNTKFNYTLFVYFDYFLQKKISSPLNKDIDNVEMLINYINIIYLAEQCLAIIM